MSANKISVVAAVLVCIGCGGGTEVTRNQPDQGGALAIKSLSAAVDPVDPAKANAPNTS